MVTEHDEKELATVHPLLQSLFIAVSARHNIGVAQGARTVAESIKNKETHHSWLSDPRHSEHIPGPDGWAHAFDFFVRNADSTANWQIEAYPPIVDDFKKEAAARGIPIICGLDWKQKDAGHIQFNEAALTCTPGAGR